MNKSASLVFKNVSFSFGTTQAVQDFSLEVASGSFTTFLGPSGCGKTTLLRLVSGFLLPDGGQILIDGIDQKNIPAEDRQIGMVFQDYALFPHMTVEQNLLYGLEIKNKNLLKQKDCKFTKKELHDKSIAQIHKTARILGIAPLLERFPHELSGGQQQRSALGRALVLEPKILLMDEPLSSLDAKLRIQVRQELKEIQSQFKITTIYVTHDQEEALSLSDSIAVINHGKLLQHGTPRQIYFNPQNEFTADFVGAANFINAGGKRIAVRPEWFELLDQKTELSENPEMVVKGRVVSSSFLGEKNRYKIKLDDENCTVLNADLSSDYPDIPWGSQIYLKIKKSLELH